MRKILYMLLIGGFLCMVLVGVLKYIKEPTLPTKVSVTEPPLKQEEIVTAQDTPSPVRPTEEPRKTKEPQETDVPRETKEPQETNAPRETKAPQETNVPRETKEPQETNVPRETKVPQETNVPRETKAPQETKTPMPQNTQPPIPTKDTSVEEEVHEHDFEKSVWELPTCQKGGYYNNICKICGFVECVSQEPLPHETEDSVIQEGNCMEDRVIRHVCKLCGEQTESDTRYPVYDEHQWEREEVDGAVVEYCERCGIVK